MPLRFDGKGRAGKIGAATRRSILGHPEASERALSVLEEITIATADLVDGCRRAGDARGFLAASKDLQELLGRLGVNDGGDSARADDGGRPAEDGRAGFMADLVGAGPESGDAEDA